MVVDDGERGATVGGGQGAVANVVGTVVGVTFHHGLCYRLGAAGDGYRVLGVDAYTLGGCVECWRGAAFALCEGYLCAVFQREV